MLPSEFCDLESNTGIELTLIQKGGTCDIYRTLIHNKLHVIKRINKENCKNPVYIESLRREFEISFPLDHQSIVRTIQYDLDEEGGSILMEYIDGLNLCELVQTIKSQNKTIDWKSIFLQLCDAVSYLHSKQIYHLDLKPENIMITARNQRVKIIDFGHAAMDGNLNDWGGTQGYMPPERNMQQFSSLNDIYSMGKIIEFCTRHEEPKTAVKWDKIIALCLNKDVNKRINSAELLAREIQKIGSSLTSFKQIGIIGFVSFFVFIIFLFNRKSALIKNIQFVNNHNYTMKDRMHPINKINVNNSIMFDPKQTNHIKSSPNFTFDDSMYLIGLTNKLFREFELQSANPEASTVGNQYKLLNKLQDTISVEWNRYLTTLPEYSMAYEKAVRIYYKKVNESIQKCVKLIAQIDHQN